LLLLDRIDARDPTDRLLIQGYRFGIRIGFVQQLLKFLLPGDQRGTQLRDLGLL
jgi:hypothetical protein